jgi:hypothetical protein
MIGSAVGEALPKLPSRQPAIGAGNICSDGLLPQTPLFLFQEAYGF